jgi:F5/8 type C domain
MIDAAHQIRGLLPINFGGTANDFGYGQGLFTPWAYFPAGYSSGTTTPAPYGALVQVNTRYPSCQMTSTAADRAIGVVLGTFDPSNSTVTEGDVAAGDMAAIAHVGVVDVLFSNSGVYGQFVQPSGTLGEGRAVSGFTQNSIGILLAEVTAGGLGKVLLVNTLGSISAGSNTSLSPSYPGDLAVGGSTGLMADAGHQHKREPDVNGIHPLAAATASSSNGAHTPDKAIDGNSGTYWESTGTITSQWLQVDLGLSRFVTRWVLVQQGNGGNNFTAYNLQYSDDGSTWTTYANRTGQAAMATDEVDDIGLAHRYWRMAPTAGTGNAQVQELTIYSLPWVPLDATTGVGQPQLMGTGTRNGSNFLRDDGTWSLPSTGLTNPMTTKGDVIVGAASPAGNPARLGVGSDGQFLEADSGSTNGVKWGAPPSSTTANKAYLGDGSDSSAHLDGTATVAWASKSSSTYTMTRDAFVTSLTIDSGVTLVMANFRIFCQGTLTNSGYISGDGTAGGNGNSGGGAGAAGTVSPGKGGGAGGVGSGVANGSGGTGTTNTGLGGNGGAGGRCSSSGSPAGTAGTGGVNTVNNGIYHLYSMMPYAMWGWASSFVLSGTFQPQVWIAGAGGGGGAGNGILGAGGHGGGGGNQCIIVANAIDNSAATAIISANGGAGGNGAASTENGGGGGGGGGGIVILIYNSILTGSGTIRANGGALGTKGGGVATDGAAGSAGLVYQLALV